MANKSAKVDEKSYILKAQPSQTNQQNEYLSPGSESEQSCDDDTKQLFATEGDDKLQSSLPLASFNFINSIIGSGVIGIPYALHEAGFGLGLLLLVVVAYLTDYSLVLMVRSGHLSGSFTYQGVMDAAFGRPGYILLSFLQFMYPFVAMVSYNVVVGDTVTRVIVRITNASPDSLIARREVVIALSTFFLTLPLCLYRDIAKLAKVSFLSLIFIIFILIAIFIRLGSMQDIVPDTVGSWRLANWDFIPAIGIMAFAFMCHHNTFLIYSSIERADQRRWDLVTHISLAISLAVSILFGVAGYATFRGFSQGDLLENYCWDDDLMNLARLGFSLTTLLTYPIECFVSREVLESTLFARNNDEPGQHHYDPYAHYRHVGLTLTIVIITYFLSLSTDCLGVVLELNGVFAAVPLAYVLPAVSYLKLEEGSILGRKKLPALGLALFGIVVASIGAVLALVNWNRVDTCSHGKVMFYCAENNTIHQGI